VGSLREPANASGGGVKDIRRNAGRDTLVLAIGSVIAPIVTLTVFAVAAKGVGFADLSHVVCVWTAVCVLVALAAIDLGVVPRVRLAGWHRQTPKFAPVGGKLRPFFWGFDAGLMITTYRASTAAWALIALVLLGLASPVWLGAAYGGSFAVSFAALVLPGGLSRFRSWRGRSTDRVVRGLLRSGKSIRVGVAVSMLGTVASFALS
jgi:hypothetical protein